MFFESLADERGTDARVRVLIVDPGIMDTEMQVNIRAHAREDAYFPGRERFIDRYDRGELPSPVDVARRIIAQHLD
jgi:NAD(P)-dependent dehydrogenase (short-subunit alcohol dehydrogenase family)